jgi:hypothetical protein
MIPMPMTEQDMLPANDLGDRTPREDNEEASALETDSTLRDAHEERQTPELPAQEMYSGLPDASLQDCRVAMVPLDAIYVEGDQQDEDLVIALADSIVHIGLQHPICVVKNDLPEQDTPYRIVSGRQRYQAYKSLGREYIMVRVPTPMS